MADLLTMTLWLQNRKRLVVAASLSMVLIGGAVQNASAVYQVHDSKVYAQIVEQIKKAQEQISQLKAQYDLQVKNMQDLKKEHVDPILKDIGFMKNEYEKTRKGMDSLWQTGMKTPDVFRQTFEDIKNIRVRASSYNDINGKAIANRDKLERLNKELMVLISKKQKELEKSNKRIAELTALIPGTKGEKAIADLQAHLMAENVRAGNIAAEIQSLQTKQNTIKTEAEKLEKDANQKVIEKTADDFQKAAEELKKAADAEGTMRPGEDGLSRAVRW